MLALTKFNTSFAEARKQHVSNLENVEKAVLDAVLKLRQAPEFGPWEPMPPKCLLPEKMQFRKLEFGIPGFTGVLTQWRLMYFYAPDQHSIWLLWLYSHRDFPKRPSADELRRVMLEALKEFGKA